MSSECVCLDGGIRKKSSGANFFCNHNSASWGKQSCEDRRRANQFSSSVNESTATTVKVTTWPETSLSSIAALASVLAAEVST